MRYIVDKMPERPQDCPFSLLTLYNEDCWCDHAMQVCAYFCDPKSSRVSCLGLVSLTGLLAELNNK